MKHFVSATCQGEICGHALVDDGSASSDEAPRANDDVPFCGQPATHKVGEEIPMDDNRNRHNLTMYVCCEHFGQILGPLARRICQGWRD